MKVAIGMLGMHTIPGCDFPALRDIVAMADKKGIDQVVVFDHVVMGQNFDEYPTPPFTGTPDFPFLEPMIELAGYAAVTRHIRLSTGIIIAPLRPAAILAKQIATLDVLSQGRVDIGLGVGWQSAEYRACGIDYENRFDIMEEQIRVCRALWSGETVSFHGRHNRFDDITAMPRPVQGAGLPIWLGIALKRRNVERLAELGDGWCPIERDPVRLRAGIETLRRAFEERGRDPGSLQTRVTPTVERGSDGKISLDETLARTREYADAGVTMLRLEMRRFCRRLEDVEPFLEKIAQIKDVV